MAIPFSEKDIEPEEAPGGFVMALTPLEIQKMRFNQRMRGYDPTEVESFLSLLAEEMTARLAQLEKLERENRYYRQRLEEAEQREHQLQQTLLRAQKVSDEILANARREAELTVKEAEMAADKIVQQAIEQSTRVESRIAELRTARRELQLKFKNTLDLFQGVLEAEIEDERTTATVLTLPRKRREA
jgi:cell division initiation protein